MYVTITEIVDEDDDRVLLRGRARSGAELTFPLVYGAHASRTQAIVNEVRAGQKPSVNLPFEELDDE
jgi:hypothetical protein